MTKREFFTLLVPVLFLFFAAREVALAADDLKSLELRVKSLEDEVSSRFTHSSPESEEITKLRLELHLPEALNARFTGLGPAVSRVYFSDRPLSIGALADISYHSDQASSKSTDVGLVDVMVGYKFSKRLIANLAVAFQNGGAVNGAAAGSSGVTPTGVGSSGAARVEYAYVDFLLADNTGIRAGNVLVPFGITNLRFEPTLYPTVKRPGPETVIIPSTWQENGALFFGHSGSIVLQAGVLSSGEAANYQTSTWIRSGRVRGANARAQSAAWVGRAEWLENDSSAGVSVYVADTNQGNSSLGRAQVHLAEAHIEGRVQDRVFARGLYVEGQLGDTEKILSVTGQAVGKKARGAQVLLSYDLLPRMAPVARSFIGRSPPPDWKELPVFVSWEHVNPQAEAADGASPVDSLRTNTFLVGANYRPHPQVTVKADFAHVTDGNGQTSRVYETGLSFVF